MQPFSDPPLGSLSTRETAVDIMEEVRLKVFLFHVFCPFEIYISLSSKFPTLKKRIDPPPPHDDLSKVLSFSFTCTQFENQTDGSDKKKGKQEKDAVSSGGDL